VSEHQAFEGTAGVFMPEEGIAARFPFSAVVGQEQARLALILAASEPRIGGVLLTGEKGSAKTTLARGLASLLPGDAPFVELPLGALEDRVLGALDLKEVLGTGERHLTPGLVAQANGGVLYVDEVNLLADHLVDVLLDAAASGICRVERDGVSAVYESRFVLVGSMNPEEGELRPQLLDRFGLAVSVEAPKEAAMRAEAVRRRLEHDTDPVAFVRRFEEEEDRLRRCLATARPASLPDVLVEQVAELCVLLGAEGLRADVVCCRAASALAGIEGRGEATPGDVRRVAAMVLGHRRRRGPFDEPGVDRAELERALDEVFGRGEQDGGPGSTGAASSGGEQSGNASERDGALQESVSSKETKGDSGAPGTTEGETLGLPDGLLGTQLSSGHLVPRAVPGPGRQSSARRTSVVPGKRVKSEGRRGRFLRSIEPDPAGGFTGAVAVSDSLVAALGRGRRPTGSDTGEGDLLVGPEDLREAIHEEQVSCLMVLAVDVSGSMGATKRLEAARGAVVSLLLDAYRMRDRVAVVCFGGGGARELMKPTGSVEVARARLSEVPTGGRTPLASGIAKALEVATRPSASLVVPMIALVSDGRATAAGESADPFGEALDEARRVRQAGVPAVVLDAEAGGARLGLAERIASVMGARHVRLEELSAPEVARALKEERARITARTL
jgi:magnesium chelatase subunit D